MKKVYSLIAVFFACILAMPLFAGCNSSGGTEVRGVKFNKDVYEADVGSVVKLNYLVFPSTAKDYNVTFLAEIDKDNPQQMFSLNDKTGEFQILSNRLDTAKVTVTVNGHKATCVVNRKIYPDSISFSQSQATVNAGGTYMLSLFGNFSEDQKMIDDSKFNLEVTSSNPSVLTVDKNNPLAICSTGVKGTATITAKIKDSNGKYVCLPNSIVDLEATITIKVTQNVEYAVATLEGNIQDSKNSQFLNLSSYYQQTSQNTYVTSDNSVRLSVALFSQDNVLVQGEFTEVLVNSTNPSVAEVQQSANSNTYNFVINLKQTGTTRIEITSNCTDSEGAPVKFIFYIQKV